MKAIFEVLLECWDVEEGMDWIREVQVILYNLIEDLRWTERVY